MTCVSELAVDRLIAGELGDADAAAVRDHVSRCPRCARGLDRVLVARTAFEAAPPRLAIERDDRGCDRSRTNRQRWVVATAMATVAIALAVAALVVAWPSELVTRTKGSPSLGFYVAHAGDVRRGGRDERVAPGDSLQLYTNAGESGWMAVTSIDAAGVHSVYVEPRPFAAGREELLPFSIVVDATLGHESVEAVFCPGPFAVLALPASCTFDRLSIIKGVP